MNCVKLGVWAGLLLGSLALPAQKSYKFRVQLTDKQSTTYSLDKPEEFLSERAVQRRVRQGIAVDSTDLPVCREYIEKLEACGARFLSASKWNNTVLMQAEDENMAGRFRQLSFVKEVKKVWTSPDSIPARDKDWKKQVRNKWNRTDDFYGAGAEQIRMHHGDSLHLAGFKGKGMQIAVIDAGFFNVDEIRFFRKMNLLGVRDFVNPASDIYEEHSHGLSVLSCMATNEPHVMVGTAPEAAYWLLRSEDNDTEQPVEEDNWAAAIEFADSVGVDVVNTSLGYYAFDDSTFNYRYRDLDGRTSLMALSAAHAADKGMLVVCSAGNSGAGTWKKITPPADAENVITVGAIDRKGMNATFSSLGYTADGRVKPDVMAVGLRSSVVGTDGGVSFANGTSFASPIFCGLATCLWQACPWLSVRQLIEVIHQSGDRAQYPDNIFGYGVSDVWKAYHLGLKLKDKK